jgi:hypothetical protein
MQNTQVAPPKVGLFLALIATVIGIFILLTLLAGLPPTENIPGFMIGILILIAVTVGIAGLGWYLLVKPMPADLKPSPTVVLSASTRSIVALFLTLGALSMGVAGVWDEIWHSTYGIPFGEDFFWRPHLMLYFSFLTMIIVGGWSFWTVMTRVKGTLQQKFRNNALLGASFLGGLFTFYAVGADPIWHKMYGSDLAPWSLPHLLILILILIMALLATSFHKTLMTNRDWRIGVKQFSWRDVLIALVLVGCLIDFLLIFTIQWYAGVTANELGVAAASAGASGEEILALSAQIEAETRELAATQGVSAAQADANVRVATGGMRQLSQLASYPDWLFGTFLTFIVALFGAMALHTTRFAGSATLVGVMALAVRFGLDEGFNGIRSGTTPLLIIVPLMIVLDLVYAYFISRTQKPPAFWVSAIAIAVGLTTIGYVLIPALFPFTQSNVGVLPMRFITSFLTAAGGIWLAQLLGKLNAPAEATPTAESILAPGARAILWVYGGFAVFLVLFIVTASPPV